MNQVQVKDKLAQWLENNPDGWLFESDQSIAKQAGVSPGSVARHLSMLVAKKDGIMPSEVRKRRQDTRPFSGRTKVDLNNIRKIIEENPNTPTIDLAFMADCSEQTIERLLEAINPENDEIQRDNGDGTGDFNSEITAIRSDLENIKMEIETVLTRLDGLSDD